MNQFDEREEWYAFNQETIDALLEDGSQADADYTICLLYTSDAADE